MKGIIVGLIRNINRIIDHLKTEGFNKSVERFRKKTTVRLLKNGAIFSRCLPSIVQRVQSIAYPASNPEELFDFASNLFGGVIKPSQEKDEFLQFLEMAHRDNAKTFLEIGSEKGGNLFMFLKTLPDDTIGVSLDLPVRDGGYGFSDLQARMLHSFTRPSQALHIIRQNSTEDSTVKKVWQALNGRKLDFLFIDGDHSYESVKKDFELYSGMVRDGGIIAFHDILPSSDPGIKVDRFWAQLKTQYEWREFIAPASSMGIGVLPAWKAK